MVILMVNSLVDLNRCGIQRPKLDAFVPEKTWFCWCPGPLLTCRISVHQQSSWFSFSPCCSWLQLWVSMATLPLAFALRVTLLSPSSPDPVHTFCMAINFSRSESAQKQWEGPLRTPINIKHNCPGSEFWFLSITLTVIEIRAISSWTELLGIVGLKAVTDFFCQDAVIAPIVCLAYIFSQNSEENPTR